MNDPKYFLFTIHNGTGDIETKVTALSLKQLILCQRIQHIQNQFKSFWVCFFFEGGKAAV